jgi:alkylation response protein AidB-like acyl-CoA dehydrogenase
MKGGGIGPEASTNKIFWSELDVMLNRTALSILGAHAELFPAPLQADVERNPWLEDYLFALAGPIYAGTNEIQRNIIAERMLGLPR